MTKNRILIVYLLIFLVASILLRLFGIFNFTSSELLSYTLIFAGFGLFFNSFGKGNKALLFSSSFIFLWGVILFLINNFEFTDNSTLIFPALVLNIGFSFLIVFINNIKDKIYLIISLIFILFGTLAVLWKGNFNSSIFLSSLVKIAINYWPIVLIAGGLIFILTRSEKKQ